MVTYRHDTVKQLLASLAKECGADAEVEPRQVVYSDMRHPDVGLVMGAAQISIDVTIKYPLSPSYIRRFGQHSLGTALEGERLKRERYEMEAKEQGVTFVPFSIEATGAWGPSAVELVKALADHAAEHTAWTRHEALAMLSQGISVAVQRGNCLLLNSAYQQAQAAANASPPVHDLFLAR